MWRSMFPETNTAEPKGSPFVSKVKSHQNQMDAQQNV